jgi:hypothetical protein
VTVVASGAGVVRGGITGPDGTFAVADVPAGSVTLSATLEGFAPQRRSLSFGAGGLDVDIVMPVGALEETMTVFGSTPNAKQVAQPSQNIINLQQRAAGVLPVRVDVPRAGTSHSFSKPLVIDQETTVSFRYRQR